MEILSRGPNHSIAVVVWSSDTQNTIPLLASDIGLMTIHFHWRCSLLVRWGPPQGIITIQFILAVVWNIVEGIGMGIGYQTTQQGTCWKTTKKHPTLGAQRRKWRTDERRPDQGSAVIGVTRPVRGCVVIGLGRYGCKHPAVRLAWANPPPPKYNVSKFRGSQEQSDFPSASRPFDTTLQCQPLLNHINE